MEGRPGTTWRTGPSGGRGEDRLTEWKVGDDVRDSPERMLMGRERDGEVMFEEEVWRSGRGDGRTRVGMPAEERLWTKRTGT